jgi:hypothetical protein
MNKSQFIIETLYESQEALEDQNQQTAIRTLKKITDEITHLAGEANALKVISKEDQSENSIQLSSIIKQIGDVHADSRKKRAELKHLEDNVTFRNISIAELNNNLDKNNQLLKAAEEDLSENKKNVNPPAFQFGGMGNIGMSLVQKGKSDAAKKRIPIIQGEINLITNEKNELNKKAEEDEGERSRLLAVTKEIENTIEDLEFDEFKNTRQEFEIRKKVVFFTKIHSFYSNLQNLLSNISNKINNVTDIVNSLDNETPTIASFDPSVQDSLSLKEAVILFGENVAKKIPTETSIPIFDENSWYSFSTQLLGETKSLTVGKDVTSSKMVSEPFQGHTSQHSEQVTTNSVFLDDKSDSLNQYWKIKSLEDGNFRLTNKWLEEDKSLEIRHDGTMHKLIMAESSNSSKQIWKIEPAFGFFDLSCEALEKKKSLKVNNFGTYNELQMNKSGNYAGQHWLITAINKSN